MIILISTVGLGGGLGFLGAGLGFGLGGLGFLIMASGLPLGVSSICHSD